MCPIKITLPQKTSCLEFPTNLGLLNYAKLKIRKHCFTSIEVNPGLESKRFRMSRELRWTKI